VKTLLRFHEQAEFLRESSGSNIEKTLRKAVRVLKLFEIPHLVGGGFAVQEHGYPRFTVDVDLIVPDVEAARDRLCMNGFRENPGSKMTVTDRETRVEVDLHPGGGSVDPGPVPIPVPLEVSDEPQILPLERLISSKLSTYIARGIARAKDYADVVELMKANDLPRDYPVDPAVRDLYRKMWDELRTSQA
jgi:Nucleotidyl transferase AbiEii toxin, Type IV TA system